MSICKSESPYISNAETNITLLYIHLKHFLCVCVCLLLSSFRFTSINICFVWFRFVLVVFLCSFIFHANIIRQVVARDFTYDDYFLSLSLAVRSRAQYVFIMRKQLHKKMKHRKMDKTHKWWKKRRREKKTATL